MFRWFSLLCFNTHSQNHLLIKPFEIIPKFFKMLYTNASVSFHFVFFIVCVCVNFIVLINFLFILYFFYFRFFLLRVGLSSSAEDFGITRIAGLPWAQWNAGLAMPLVAEMEVGSQPIVLPSNDTSSSSPPPLYINEDSAMGNGLVIDEHRHSDSGKLSDSEKNTDANYTCNNCGRFYKLKSSLRNHQKWECGKEPQFSCPYCVYKAKQKMHINRHLERMHKEKIMESVNGIPFPIKEEKLNATM